MKAKHLAAYTVAVLAAFALAVHAGWLDLDTAVASVLLADAGAAADLKKLEAAMKEAFAAMGDNIKKTQDLAEQAREEVRKEGTLHGETNKKLTALGENFNKLDGIVQTLSNKWSEAKDRLQDVEQKLARRPGGIEAPASPGQTVTDSPEYKAIQGKDMPQMSAVKVGSFFNVITGDNTSVSSTTGQLVIPDRQAGVIMPALRRLTIRDLLPVGRTGSNLIEFATENVFTNNAGIQGADSSPSGQFEGQPKAQSALTFTLSNAPVRTIATWLPASRQVLSDAPFLQSYVDQRLTYAIKLDEEDELLNGDGTGGHINGLVNQAAAYNRGASQDTILDTLLKGFLQVSLAEYEASGVVLNPIDWTNIMLLKDTQGRYLFADPHSMEMPRVWGKSVVPTQSMTAGQFLAGAFALCAQIWDREDATVRIAEQHSDFFVRNLVVLLAEERVALTVYRPTALVTGALVHEA